MVTGRLLLGKSVPADKLRVWLITTEDPIEEIERRVQAACLHYKITEEDIGGRLFIDAGRKSAVIVATEIREGVKIVEPNVDALRAGIKERQIDVLMIDPLADFHEVNENDNKKIGNVMNVWADIAEDMDIAIEAAHHARKPASGADQTVSWADARGAVTIINKSRDSRVMNRMSKKEAERAGITNPRSYFSLISAKYNLIAPPENADWYQLVGEFLDNGGEEPGDRGDNIGVIEPWEWPSLVSGITAEQRQEILTRISKHPYRASARAADWVGKMVAEVLRRSLENEADKTHVLTQLEHLRTTHAIKFVDGKDEHRNTVPFVVVDQWVNDDNDIGVLYPESEESEL